MSLGAEPQGAQGPGRGKGPRAGSTYSATALCSACLPGTALQGWDGVGTRHWQDREGKPCAVGGRGGGWIRQGAGTLVCSGFPWAGAGHSSALQCEIKEGSTAPPSWPQAATRPVPSPVGQTCKRASTVSSAAHGELRVGTPEHHSAVGAVKGTGAISTNNPSGHGARDNWVGKGLGKLLERRQRLWVGYLPFPTGRSTEMEKVKLELLRTGSMSTVRGCSRGLISAGGIPAGLKGVRGACGFPQSTASLPSLTRTNTHTIKPADIQSVLLV